MTSATSPSAGTASRPTTPRGPGARPRLVVGLALLDDVAAPTRLLVASLRSRQACLDVIALGARAITIRPALFAELIDHEPTRAAERVFLADARADD